MARGWSEGVCSGSLSFFRWKCVLYILSKHHHSLGNSLNGSWQRRRREREPELHKWCNPLLAPAFLYILPFPASHSYILIYCLRLFPVFAPLLPFRLYFPVAHSTLLGYFLWYTNVSLPFNLSVYLPLPSLLLCLPVHSLRLLSLLPGRCFPSLSSSILCLSPLVCCNTGSSTPGGSRDIHWLNLSLLWRDRIDGRWFTPQTIFIP